MKNPFWRCAIISLLLWALPVQWLAAATSAPCAGHVKAQGEANIGAMAHDAPERAQPSKLRTDPHLNQSHVQIHDQQHVRDDAQQRHHHLLQHEQAKGQDQHQDHKLDHGLVHAHGPLAVSHADTKADSVAGTALAHGAASADSHAQCASAGHCCLSAALLPAAMPDFAQPRAAAQFAPLAQPHRTPLLSGPDRPPQAHLA